jgi:hypothetical protein
MYGCYEIGIEGFKNLIGIKELEISTLRGQSRYKDYLLRNVPVNEWVKWVE